MKGLFLGILLIIIIGIGGFVYRNAVEQSLQPIACPLDAKLCPDGTAVPRIGSSCTFAECALPNVSLVEAGISFAIPAGFDAAELPDMASVVAYEGSARASTTARIIIRQYVMTASTTALAIIQQTAVRGDGAPVGVTSFSSSVFGGRRFTVVSIERSGEIVDTAYYLARGIDVLRFDAIDTDVMNWGDQDLNHAALPAHAALATLLVALQML
ncbi:MAG: hypothetical protein AAB709_00780 [Patescibacteria group bacterium]